MISLSVGRMPDEIAELIGRFQALPSYMAKKHIVAALRAGVRDSGGTKVLRQLTPPVNTRRGRRRKGEKRSTGALRKAVMVKAKWIGTYQTGAAVAGLGYRYGVESQKAIWHEFGTSRMAARKMMERAYQTIREPVARKLSGNLAVALERAATELASGRNPGMSKRGRAAGL